MNVYPLISYSSLTDNSGGFSGWTIAGVPGGYNYSLLNNAGVIDLDVGVIVVAGTWTAPGSGSWADTGNWTANVVPDGVGAAADFDTSIGSNAATVTMDGPHTPGPPGLQHHRRRQLHHHRHRHPHHG